MTGVEVDVRNPSNLQIDLRTPETWPQEVEEGKLPIWYDPVRDTTMEKKSVVARRRDDGHIEVQAEDGEWVVLPPALYGHYVVSYV